MLNINKNIRGIVYYVSFIFLTICSTIITKKANMKWGIDVLQFLFYRTIICCFILLPFAVKDKMPFLRPSNYKKTLSIGLHMLTIYIWYYAIQAAPLNSVSIVAFIVPIFVNIFAIIFLKEKISRNLWITIAFCLGAVYFMNQDKMNFSHGASISYAPAFVFVITRSIAIILGKNASKESSPIQLVYTLCFTGLFLGPIMAIILPFEWKMMPLQAWIYEGWNVILYLIQMWLMYKAFKLSNVSTLQPFEFTKFLFSMLLSCVFLSEHPTMIQLVSAAIIFSSNFFLMRKYM